jgi:hypothetical protein
MPSLARTSYNSSLTCVLFSLKFFVCTSLQLHAPFQSARGGDVQLLLDWAVRLRNTGQQECRTNIVCFHASPDYLPHWRSMRVHLICQLPVFLCSLASACINSISSTSLGMSSPKLELVQCRCRGSVSEYLPMCRGAHSVQTDFSGMPLGKAKFVAHHPTGKKRSSWNFVCSALSAWRQP